MRKKNLKNEKNKKISSFINKHQIIKKTIQIMKNII